MAGIKRKSGAPIFSDTKSTSKKVKVDKSSKRPSEKHAVSASKPSDKAKAKKDPEKKVKEDFEDEENAGEEEEDGFSGFSDDEGAQEQTQNDRKTDFSNGTAAQQAQATVSKQAHAAQKALAKERKAAKPNADVVERSKLLWEALRVKTNVSKEERQVLINELYEIVRGRVTDFVFKHDSVRVIQTAIKYSSAEFKREIAQELKGHFRTLAEGKYSKHLIAKLLEKGDPEIQNLILSEFYGHVRRLINHPEAAWVLDDTYRQVATSKQKTRLLREWYGPEFSIQGFQTKGISDTADLAVILEKSPEKRKPILEFLHNMINQLIQKKLTGFTMLHDAMLQYFLACSPGSSEANEFLEHLKPDATVKEGEEADNVDLLRNLAFTKSGSRLMSLAFAYGSAKDRKLLLRPYKDTMELMAFDKHAHHVLLAALAVTDDTKLISKSLYGELLPSNDKLSDKVLSLVNDPNARKVLLYPFVTDAKWLLSYTTQEQMKEIYALRATTSKKDPNTRMQEIAKAIQPQLLSVVTSRTADLASFMFGIQFMSEILLGGPAPEVEPKTRKAALSEVAQLSRQILHGTLSDSENGDPKVGSHGKNMLKTLVQGGKYDFESKKVVPVNPSLGFADMFWDQVKNDVIEWAKSHGSFVIVGLLESEDFDQKDEVLKALKKGRSEIEAASVSLSDNSKANGYKQNKKQRPGHKEPPKKGNNAGARILLEKLD